MRFTRRRLLRDASLVSFAGALGARSAFAFPNCQPTAQQGVRLFFGGSWLFCAGPDATTMLAVSLDPSTAKDANPKLDPPHAFPYGPWRQPPPGAEPGWWNLTTTTRLPVSTLAQPTVARIAGAEKDAALNIDTLFTTATDSAPFTYLPPPDNGTRNTVANPQPDYLQLRVVQIPIPASLLTAAYRADATIHDPAHRLKNLQSGWGVATSYILQYPNATNLTVDGMTPMEVGSGPLDFLFHSVPTAESDPGHAARMFQRLTSLLNITDITLTTGSETITAGPCPPQGVPDAEVDYYPNQRHNHLSHRSKQKPELRFVFVATCDSGGLGAG